MKNSEITFGEVFFENIEDNEHLIRLYGDILYSYVIKVFGYNRRLKKNLPVNDTLRFADILSESNHGTKADKHRVWAQEIVAMLNFMYPDNKDISYIAGPVLTIIGSYQGRNIIESEFDSSDTMEKLFLEYKKKFYTIPSVPDK